MKNVSPAVDPAVENQALKTENLALRAELAEVKQKLSWLLEQLSSSRRRQYGPSSEKSAYDGAGEQMGLFADSQADAFVFAPAAPAGEGEDGPPPKAKPKKRGEMGARLPAGLPVETVECVLPEEGRTCQAHKTPMRSIGKEVVRRELKFIPAKAVVTEYVRHSYACKSCEAEGMEANIVKAPLPPQLIKGSMCAPETVAHIIAQKCVMGAPLYRQEQDWRRRGIPIARQTMASWLIRCSEDYFEPLYSELHRLLCARQFAQCDETSFQVLREPGKPAQSKSQMWVYRTAGEAEQPIVLYDYQPDRKQERPRDFLRGFSGYLMTDGYQAYHSLPDSITVVGCFAHARRRYADALKCLKESERPGSLALAGKEYCDKLFAIEREAKEKGFEERRAIRLEKAKPILDEFRAWLDGIAPSVAPKSKLGMAVNYTLNQWKYLIRYLLDGRIEISTNRCERSVKPFVINRKNFLFATSVAGARAAAVLHSLTETAKENGLDPFEYLCHVLRTALTGDVRSDPALLNSLLPGNAPASCRAVEG